MAAAADAKEKLRQEVQFTDQEFEEAVSFAKKHTARFYFPGWPDFDHSKLKDAVLKAFKEEPGPDEVKEILRRFPKGPYIACFVKSLGTGRQEITCTILCSPSNDCDILFEHLLNLTTSGRIELPTSSYSEYGMESPLLAIRLHKTDFGNYLWDFPKIHHLRQSLTLIRDMNQHKKLMALRASPAQPQSIGGVDSVGGGVEALSPGRPGRPVGNAWMRAVVVGSGDEGYGGSESPPIPESLGSGRLGMTVDDTDNGVRTLNHKLADEGASKTAENKYFPDPIGNLVDGLRSRVVDEATIQILKNRGRTGSMRVISMNHIADATSLSERIRDSDPNSAFAKLIVRYSTTNGTTVYLDKPESIIGSGGEGTVRYGLFFPELRGDKENIATYEEIKVCAGRGVWRPVAIKLYFYFEHVTKNLSDEIEILQSKRFEVGVCEYIDGFETPNNYVILVQELCVASLLDLMDLVKKGSIAMDINERLSLVRAACLAVEELHRHEVTHMDVRTPNFLITAEGCLKICDFNLSRKTKGGITIKKTFKKMLSQPFENQPTGDDEDSDDLLVTSPAVDVFMLGSVVWTILAGKPPFKNDPMIAEKANPDWPSLVQAIARKDAEGKVLTGTDGQPLLPAWGSSLIHLLTSMINHEKDSRPQMADVMRHPFFSPFTDHRAIIFKFNILFHKKPVVLGPELELATIALKTLDEDYDYENLYESLPKFVRDEFVAIQPTPPKVTKLDGAVIDHPLPTLWRVIYFTRNFIEHLIDRKRSEFRSSLDEYVGDGENPWWVLLAHPFFATLFQGLWNSKVVAMTQFKERVRLEEEEIEKLQQEYDDKLQEIEQRKSSIAKQRSKTESLFIA